MTPAYQAYMESPTWGSRRQDALWRANDRCQVCNNGGDLHVHHRTYVRLGQELPEDLTVLCRSCHFLFHGVNRIIKVGFYQTADDIRTAIAEYSNKDPPETRERILEMLVVTGRWYVTSSSGNNADYAMLHVEVMSHWPGSIANDALIRVIETSKNHDLPAIGYYTHAVANELNKWRETLQCLKALLTQQEAFEHDHQIKPTEAS